MKLKYYSSGMKSRLAFSLARMSSSNLFLIDETLAVGDKYFQEKCFIFFDEIKKNTDKTILFVSHSQDPCLFF